METEDIEKYTRPGLRRDIECLLQQFLHTQSVRFQMFAEEWRKLNFTFIHYGIERAQEKKETMQEAFKIATEYLLPPYDFQRRVGALYILYALYMTQPYVPKFKIRISLDQWQKVVALVDTVQSQGHLDTMYVFHKMTHSKAFMFTATPKKMIFHPTYMEGKTDQHSTERWLERHRHSLMTECFDDNTLEVHHELHEQYQKMKVDLGLHDNTSLMVVRESITENIVKRFEKLEADFEAGREVQQTTCTDASDSEETANRGSKRSQIKARSFSTITTPSRSRRHRQETRQPPSSPESPAPKSPIKKGKRGRKSKHKDPDSPNEKLTRLERNRLTSLPATRANQKKRLTMVRKIKKVRADNFSEDDSTEPFPTQPRRGTKRFSEARPEASTASASGLLRSGKTQKKAKSESDEPKKKPNPASVAPKRKTTASRKASQKQCSPRKATAKTSPPSKSSQENPQETPKKRRRLRSDTLPSPKRDASEDISPKKRLRVSGKTKAETPTKKHSLANKTPDGSYAGLETRAHQESSPSRGRRSCLGQGSPGEAQGQSSTTSPRVLRSSPVGGRGSASGARGQGSASRGHRSSPGGHRSPPMQPGEALDQTKTPRSNTRLKMRGGGIGAKTRGAKQKHS